MCGAVRFDIFMTFFEMRCGVVVKDYKLLTQKKKKKRRIISYAQVLPMKTVVDLWLK